MAIKWLVPSVSRDLRDRMRREAYVTNEIIIRTELLKAQGKLNVMKNEEETPKPGAGWIANYGGVRGSMGTYMPKYSFFVINYRLR